MTLMEYLIKTGSERVAQQCRENIYAVQTLKDFQFIDRDGKDQVCVHTLQTTQGLPNHSRCEAPLTGIVKRAAWNPFKVFFTMPSGSRGQTLGPANNNVFIDWKLVNLWQKVYPFDIGMYLSGFLRDDTHHRFFFL